MSPVDPPSLSEDAAEELQLERSTLKGFNYLKGALMMISPSFERFVAGPEDGRSGGRSEIQDGLSIVLLPEGEVYGCDRFLISN
uniref:Uncharacterized protein n=1 Tax=Pristionchus pacificus TaxID=54126 RepID=A0A2A6BVJ4_PRIPA|eukprot:PDM70032.1 hypothetical protein PRIPAC_49244 [Pristionchus pacificus]